MFVCFFLKSFLHGNEFNASLFFSFSSSPVPSIFLWQDPVSGEEVYAMQHPGGYGGIKVSDCVVIPNFPHAACWDWRGDNAGPHNSDEVCVCV